MQQLFDWRTRVGLRKTRVGKGVFARKAFRKGQVIGHMRGEIIRSANHFSSYCVNLGANASLEPRTPFRYINHCCEPNCELVEYHGPDGQPQIWVHALRAIRPEAELTIDYSWSLAAAIRCLCGAKACRGWIVDADELAQLRASTAASQLGR